jgi:hypothetical protein
MYTAMFSTDIYNSIARQNLILELNVSEELFVMDKIPVETLKKSPVGLVSGLSGRMSA